MQHNQDINPTRDNIQNDTHNAQSFGYEQNPYMATSIMGRPAQTKVNPMILGVVASILWICCVVFTSIRVQMNNCSYWSLMDCQYTYQDLCCVTYSSPSHCPPDSIKLYTCKSLSELQSSNAALLTSLAIISGVLGLIVIFVFLHRKRASRAETAALMTSYARI